MKLNHVLPLAICTVAVLALLPVAVYAHRDYVHQGTLQSIRSAAFQAKANFEAKVLAHKQAEATDAKLNKLEQSCKSGLSAYNQLSASQKKNTAKPDCQV